MDRNRRFAELYGLPWHEIIRKDENTKICSCGEDYSLFDDYVCGRKNPDFTADSHLVLEVMSERADFQRFLDWLVGDGWSIRKIHFISTDYVLDKTGLLLGKAIEWMERSKIPTEQVMIKIEGQSWRCECGGNVLTKIAANRYQCNSCEAIYTGE